MSRIARILKWRPVWFTLVLLASLATYQAWLSLGAARKLDSINLDHPGPYTVDLGLTVVPEPFHMMRLQQLGRLTAVEGKHVRLQQVSRDSISELARRYWIESISEMGQLP